MEEKIYITTFKKNEAELEAKLIVTKYSDGSFIEEILFRHPITGQWEETIDQAYSGWSEQDEESNAKWDELKIAIEKNYSIMGQLIVDYDGKVCKV